MPTTQPAAAPAFDERLRPSPAGWALVPALGVMGAIVLWPLGMVPGLVAGGIALVAAAVGAVRLSTRVRVADGELHAGDAHIPARLLRAPRALDVDATRHALGPGLDARTHVVLRGWVRTAVLVEVADPADPTPSWLVSTRRPEDLVAALVAAGATPAPAEPATID
ncbi:DUF3093 domain-containing protein [Cellulomonas triticagri]|uniref:DUF3093 domain-containing protein n=1 Tax=Cellulomonas triticagri TaxID=2483352 RepID=UPI001F27AE15|nr:DUF3093 domain-containing protein [Cellulomonas triticagri]